MSDDRPIGLVAVRSEMQPLLALFQGEGQERLGDAILRTGWIAGRRVALAEILLGPVHAALGAQALILRRGVGGLISFGSAGALDLALGVGDLVVASQTVAHDAGAFQGSRFVPLGVTGRDRQGRTGYRRAFEANAGLVDLALVAAQGLGGRVQAGVVVSGGQVILSAARRHWLRQTFGALAVDMESAAVAQAAMAHGLPWVALRAISDQAGDEPVDMGRIMIYLDDTRPAGAWRQAAGRWLYVFTHPAVGRRLRRLRQGLVTAAGRAAEWAAATIAIPAGVEPDGGPVV
jgi:adenosylhomocysteine nucleosidase